MQRPQPRIQLLTEEPMAGGALHGGAGRVQVGTGGFRHAPVGPPGPPPALIEQGLGRLEVLDRIAEVFGRLEEAELRIERLPDLALPRCIGTTDVETDQAIGPIAGGWAVDEHGEMTARFAVGDGHDLGEALAPPPRFEGRLRHLLARQDASVPSRELRPIGHGPSSILSGVPRWLLVMSPLHGAPRGA